MSFIFSGQACGGPDVGYVETKALEDVLRSQRGRRPITLFGAVATSGAAFGPAMGRQAKGGLGAVMAVANARLGAWLPNPRHLHGISGLGEDVRSGGVTRKPNLPYWFREILGQYPLDERMVLTTDGGHIENLGLVELLRRRCTRILAFDASGAGATPTTLAEALVMAREELDVRVDLYGPDDKPLLDVKKFGADPFHRVAKDDSTLAERLAGVPVIRGWITYPEVGGSVGESVGTLVYGSLVLTSTTTWDVLEYGQRNPTFPNDGTDKQWFRSNTFAAYQQLGSDVASAMLAVADVPLPPAVAAPARRNWNFRLELSASPNE